MRKLVIANHFILRVNREIKKVITNKSLQYKLTYSDGGKLETWDVQSSKSLQSLRAFADSVSGIQVSNFNSILF